MVESKSHLSSRRVIELADKIESLPESDKIDLFSRYDQSQQEEVFRRLRPSQQSVLLHALNRDVRQRLFESLEPDDQVRLLARMPSRVAEELKDHLSPAKAKSIGQLLQYPAESAGRILTFDFVALSPDMNLQEARKTVREKGRQYENILILPVADSEGLLEGLLRLEDLFLGERDVVIRDIMQANPPSVQAEEDQEMVGKLMQAADVTAVPVVDEKNHLLGIVTVDDMMDIMEQEYYEDLAKSAGLETLEKPYFSLTVWHLARSRAIWLFLLAVAATLTVNVLSIFKPTLEQVVNLSLFIPLLIGVGGNAGAQAATTMVRALAVNDVRFGQILRVAAREIIVGLLLGLVLAFVAVVVVDLLFGRDMALIVSITLVVICTISSLVGSTMPLVAHRLSIDPAVISAPLVTTFVDATGLFLYFIIAKTVLGI